VFENLLRIRDFEFSKSKLNLPVDGTVDADIIAAVGIVRSTYANSGMVGGMSIPTTMNGGLVMTVATLMISSNVNFRVGTSLTVELSADIVRVRVAVCLKVECSVMIHFCLYVCMFCNFIKGVFFISIF
jgi:hypothetical protein